MRRTATAASTAIACAVILAACTPTGVEEDPTTPAESASSPGEESTSESPSRPDPSATGDDHEGPTSLPTCESIFTDAGLALVGASGLDPLGDVSAPGRGGYGTSDGDLQVLIETNESVSCTFVLAGSERGMSTSVAALDEEDRDAVVARLTATGFTLVDDTDGALYSRQEEGDSPFTEAHLLDDGVWVSSYDGFGLSAVDYVRDARAALRTIDDA